MKQNCNFQAKKNCRVPLFLLAEILGNYLIIEYCKKNWSKMKLYDEEEGREEEEENKYEEKNQVH